LFTSGGRSQELAEFGLAVLIVAVLLLTDRDRLEWLAARVRDLIEWLVTE
jgi:hypothetical protein